MAATRDSASRDRDLVRRVKAAGWRLTPQRLLILQALSSSRGHISVDQVFATVQKAYPYVDVTTVYRTLQLLKKIGVTTETLIGDKLHYEVVAPGHQHHHLVCTECGATFDLPPSYIESLKQALADGFDFQPDLTHVIVSGVCAACRRSAPGEKERAGP